MMDRDAPDNTLFAVLNLGFRPFFLLASLFAVAGIAFWLGVYAAGWPAPARLAGMSWHAHEMIYGYSLAVIAGFVLTAVQNWTGIRTVRGAGLLGLVVLWAAARGVMFLDAAFALPAAAVLDLLFITALFIAVAVPIIRAKARRQAGILAKLGLLGAGNAVFYAGAFGWTDNGVRMGLYFGLYLVIALILTMGRRLIPFFTERGVDYPVGLLNRRWIDIAGMVLFLAFAVCDVFLGARDAAAVAALALTVVYGIRLWDWHTPGLWRKPLLWSLYAGYALTVAGFPLYAAGAWLGVSPLLGVHAFAFGGIGVVTLSMMARVSLGHTGRNVNAPPRPVGYLAALLTAGAVVRVGFPLFDPAHYLWWVAISGVMWIMAFAGFALVYLPMLIKPRIDGRPD